MLKHTDDINSQFTFISDQKNASESIHLHQLIIKMASEAERLRASDIFISVDFPPAFRISGQLCPVPTKPLSKGYVRQIILSTMTQAQQDKFFQNMELNYSIVTPQRQRFRANAYHEQGRLSLVLRYISTVIPTIEQLQLPSILNQLIMKPRGLIVLAGPTGAGKSTTLAAMINYRNTHAANHILMIEDPIEFIHTQKKSLINQREIGIDTLSWENAVQNALRESPDVVCIGEVRDIKGISYAMKMAQSGHLCCCTLHASSANQAIERIVNFYPEDNQKQILMDLALNLVCIVGQRLVNLKNTQGRRAVIDLLINTPTVQDYITKGKFFELKDIMNKSTADGMQTFDQDLFRLYLDGIITFDEAVCQADSANDLRLRLKLHENGNEISSSLHIKNDLKLNLI